MTILSSFIFGTLAWSFTEYAMHRWNGHGMKGKTRFSRDHLRHHTQEDYFAPFWEKATVAVLVAALVGVIAVILAGLETGLSFTGGFMMTYVGYERLHMRLHSHGPINAFGRWARRHHFAHHFNCPRQNHGVTSPLWDVMFGSHQKIERVRVPRKKAMRWLIDEEGELYPQYNDDYVLTGRR
jgi:sterol desaturase/sphingolipid hydroxylase (fatty acid hydroxylase superfamily)